MEPTLTFHFPAASFLLSDKNRGDLDWTDGNFSWRYRNRVQIEKRLTFRRYHVPRRMRARNFYQSKYAKWSDTALYAGCLFPMGMRLELDTYYEHQNNTGKRPNQRLNQLGVKLLIELSRIRERPDIARDSRPHRHFGTDRQPRGAVLSGAIW